jgi:hypothetical protein
MDKQLQAALPPEWLAQQRQERRNALQAAAVFARVCAEGRADQLYDAHLFVNERQVGDAWRLAMIKVAKLASVSREIQASARGESNGRGLTRIIP